MRVLGIDPGSRKIGIGVIDYASVQKIRAVTWKQISLRGSELVERLLSLQDELDAVIETWKPEIVAIEDIFVRRNVRSALLLGHARGVALATVGRRQLEARSYAPARIKQTVAGHGRAGKDEVRSMVRMQLDLPEQPPEDAADALAVAMTHALIGAVLDRAGGWSR
ncbi:MAG: crossover junction endodeoxyribonuclease RuvC [Candidatus Dadabacteria bacterium]|nr:MAG: crossover junction endodeoxyribonuclease RuvC [Candidatus Dadabacteria bacterium]